MTKKANDSQAPAAANAAGANVPVVEIDSNSGFCFGVVTAIRKAEEELERTGRLACLGDIVHNASEVERLRLRGLETITHSDLENLHDSTVLLRAHGEPPATYATLRRNNISVIDATCPVVLRLQQRIKKAYDENLALLKAGKTERMPLILIYGKQGHAEVNGLVGQTDGEAVVIQNLEELESLDLDRDILLYSQTTKSIDGFRRVVEEIRRRKKAGSFEYFDTICRQVATRSEKIRSFAAAHDVVVFVSGAKSSNGKVLLEECRRVNSRTYAVTEGSEIDPRWFEGAGTVGICGATSTPAWLMEEVRDLINSLFTRK